MNVYKLQSKCQYGPQQITLITLKTNELPCVLYFINYFQPTVLMVGLMAQPVVRPYVICQSVTFCTVSSYLLCIK